MSRRAAAVLLALLAAAVAALIFVNRSGLPRFVRRGPRPFLRVTSAPPVPVTAAPGTTPAPVIETIRVTLYFPDQDGQLLHPEERDIPKPSGGTAFLKALFEELRKGPQHAGLMGAIPDKMHLRNAFLLPEGQVVLDLAVDAGLAFGSDEELTIVASLVNTTLQNVAETSRVRILVNGEPAETLGGHVDLTRPLLFIRGIVEPAGAQTPAATPPSATPTVPPATPTARVLPTRAVRP
ncbi:MAG TPA: GerMN domain-containing protein [Thermoanaerobaculia bacterium]|jgi:germination protein M|nr:GerMN domain-containing protein [Thermoanaerobaculia bacterium]